jgi:uncharacterized protein YegP (UPF0339 family)
VFSYARPRFRHPGRRGGCEVRDQEGPGGQFRFNLLATNGQVIATSETYETKRACLAGIESVRKNATNAIVDDQTAAASSKRRG